MLIRDSGPVERQPHAGDLLRQLARQGAAALENAIRDGCDKELALNSAPTRARPRRSRRRTRGTASSSSRATRPRSTRASTTASHCTPEQLVNGSPCRRRRPALGLHHPHGLRPHVPRAANNDWLPIEGLPPRLRHGLGRERQPARLQRPAAARLRRQGRPALGPPRRADHDRPGGDRRRRAVRPDERQHPVLAASRPMTS